MVLGSQKEVLFVGYFQCGMWMAKSQTYAYPSLKFIFWQLQCKIQYPNVLIQKSEA